MDIQSIFFVYLCITIYINMQWKLFIINIYQVIEVKFYYGGLTHVSKCS